MVSGLIIYWSHTVNLVKLDLAVLFFLILYFIARRVDPTQAPIDFRAGQSHAGCMPCPAATALRRDGGTAATGPTA